MCIYQSSHTQTQESFTDKIMTRDATSVGLPYCFKVRYICQMSGRDGKKIVCLEYNLIIHLLFDHSDRHTEKGGQPRILTIRSI